MLRDSSRGSSAAAPRRSRRRSRTSSGPRRSAVILTVLSESTGTARQERGAPSRRCQVGAGASSTRHLTDNSSAGGSALLVLGITRLVGRLVGRCTGPSRGRRGQPSGRRRLGCRVGRAVRGRSRWLGACRGAGVRGLGRDRSGRGGRSALAARREWKSTATWSRCTPRRPARTPSTSLRRPRDAHPDCCPRRPIVASTATGRRHCRSPPTTPIQPVPIKPQTRSHVLHLPR